MAALAATYSDLKFIRTRKVCQLVLEVPIEQAAQVVELLGAPNPAEEVWVGVARLDASVAQRTEHLNTTPEVAGSNPAGGSKPKSRAQMAGILCGDIRFRKFLTDYYDLPDACDEEQAANFVRFWCGVGSRSQFHTNPDAASKWDKLHAQYLAECG